MSSHRLPAWEPDRNYVYNDLNKPKEGFLLKNRKFFNFLKKLKKPEIYRGRFLEHNGAPHSIRNNHWTRRAPSRSHDIISGLTRHSYRTGLTTLQD